MIRGLNDARSDGVEFAALRAGRDGGNQTSGGAGSATSSPLRSSGSGWTTNGCGPTSMNWPPRGCDGRPSGRPLRSPRARRCRARDGRAGRRARPTAITHAARSPTPDRVSRVVDGPFRGRPVPVREGLGLPAREHRGYVRSGRWTRPSGPVVPAWRASKAYPVARIRWAKRFVRLSVDAHRPP